MDGTTRDNNPQGGLRKKPSLGLNALSNWIALVVGAVVGFLLMPAIMAHLGEKRFGMWMLVSSLVGYFGLLTLGKGTSVLRYVPVFRGKGDQESVSATVSTGLACYMSVGLLILTISFFFANVLSDFFEGGQELAGLIRAVGLAAALECPTRIFDASIRGHEGFILVSTVDVIGSIVRALALFGCIYMGYGLVPMGWALVIVALIILATKGAIFKSYCKGVRLNIGKISMAAFRLLLLYGLVIMVESGGHFLTVHSPKLIIGKIVSLEAVGFFGFGYMLISYYARLMSAVSRVFMPRFSYLSARSDDKEILRLFLRGSVYMAIISGSIALLIWAVGPSFLNLWAKNEQIRQVFPALIIIAAGALVWLSHRLSMELLYGLGKQKNLAAFSVAEGVCVTGLSLALSYKYGLTGVAVGASVPLMLVRGVIQSIYVCRLLKISYWRYCAGSFFKSWIIAAALAVSSYWLGVVNFAKNWPSLFLISILILLTYGSSVYLLVLGRAEKQRVNERLLRAFRRLHAGYLSKQRDAI